MPRLNGTPGVGDAVGSGLDDNAARLDLTLPDLDWSQIPRCASRTWFRVPSGRLAGLVQGNPSHPRILLVPGVTGSKEDFAVMFPLLAGAGYRVESYDLAGQYESSGAGPENRNRPSNRYDYSLFVDDLIAILESGMTPVHVLGYSFAGIVAQLALAQRPGLFASLVLMSTPPVTGQSFRGIRRIGPITGFGSDRMAAAVMIWGIRANIIPAPPGRLRFVRQRFHQTRRASVADVMGLMRAAPDVTGPLAAAAIPKLIAVGEHDLWPLAMHARFARAINATLAVYPAGHSPCESSPHALSRDLLALYRSDADGATQHGGGGLRE